MLLPKRIWKDIPGYEGLYQVSNTGKVRSLNYRGTGQTKILKQNITRYGYKTLALCKNGKDKRYFVHRLVAEAFIPNPNNLPYVNHKDEDKTNNAVWNLEWCTHEYNMNYGTINERRSKTRREKNGGLLKDKTIILRVLPQEKQCLKEIAQQRGMTITQLLLLATNKYISDKLHKE